MFGSFDGAFDSLRSNLLPARGLCSILGPCVWGLTFYFDWFVYSICCCCSFVVFLFSCYL